MGRRSLIHTHRREPSRTGDSFYFRVARPSGRGAAAAPHKKQVRAYRTQREERAAPPATCSGLCTHAGRKNSGLFSAACAHTLSLRASGPRPTAPAHSGPQAISHRSCMCAPRPRPDIWATEARERARSSSTPCAGARANPAGRSNRVITKAHLPGALLRR